MRSLELAVKYLAGDRLIGTSAERTALSTASGVANTADHTDDYGTAGNWTTAESVSGTVSVDDSSNGIGYFNNIVSNSGNLIFKDLAHSSVLNSNLSDTAWTITFKWRQEDTTLANGSTGIIINCSEIVLDHTTSGTYHINNSNNNGSQIQIAVATSGTRNWNLETRNAGARVSFVGISFAYAEDTDYWIQLSRNGAVWTANWFTNANFTGTPVSTGTITDSSASTVHDLRYFTHCSAADNSSTTGWKAKFDDLKIYDGDSTLTSSYDHPNLTNGTVFEESDTGKHWMWDGSSAWNEIG